MIWRAGLTALLVFALPAFTTAARQPPCYRTMFAGPHVRDFRAALDGCRRADCASRPVIVDARFDDLLFGTRPVTADAMRKLARGASPYLDEVRAAMRARDYRRAFRAYHTEFANPRSLTQRPDFADSPDAARVENLLSRASSRPLTTDMRELLSSLCEAHTESRQLRLYAALDRFEVHDSRNALLLVLTVPYLRPALPEPHYEAIDHAAIAQALVIDERAAPPALARVRGRAVKRMINR